MVIPDAQEEFSNSQDNVLHHREGELLKQIFELHPFYAALHYVLLFPHKQMDWNHKIPYYVPASTED